MRLQQCDVMITYLPGFQQHIADMLSRHGKNMNDFAKHECTRDTVKCMTESIDALMDTIAGPWREKLEAQSADCQTLLAVKDVIMHWWPEEKEINMLAMPYHSMRDEMAVYDGLVYKGERGAVLNSLSFKQL